jgi:hypothetical protein
MALGLGGWIDCQREAKSLASEVIELQCLSHDHGRVLFGPAVKQTAVDAKIVIFLANDELKSSVGCLDGVLFIAIIANRRFPFPGYGFGKVAEAIATLSATATKEACFFFVLHGGGASVAVVGNHFFLIDTQVL